jgi:hypothetical protein
VAELVEMAVQVVAQVVPVQWEQELLDKVLQVAQAGPVKQAVVEVVQAQLVARRHLRQAVLEPLEFHLALTELLLSMLAVAVVRATQLRQVVVLEAVETVLLV